MKLVLLAVGKRHSAEFKSAIDVYFKRLGRYVSVDWRLIDPARGKTEEVEVKRIESMAIASEIRDGDFVVLLDERGSELSSIELSELLRDRRFDASRRVICIIGGAYGVDESLRKKADLVWSLSRLTLPHQMVRLLLAEQLYRAFTIINGEPYHHS